MNSVDLANNLITRAMNLQLFEVKRMLDSPLEFNGSVPFDIRANQECAWFNVYAVSQKEAEAKVDAWLDRNDLDD